MFNSISKYEIIENELRVLYTETKKKYQNLKEVTLPVINSLKSQYLEIIYRFHTIIRFQSKDQAG
jgi:hypothetical protein